MYGIPWPDHAPGWIPYTHPSPRVPITETRAPSGPFNQNHLALGCFETQGFRATVFLGVVPALGLFEAREFEDNHTRLGCQSPSRVSVAPPRTT